MPIVGCCFCCCRLCGNCGGKRQQKETDNMHCMRRIFSVVMFGCTVFVLVGNICTYVSNDRMTTAFDKIDEIVENNLDDIDTFVDLVQQQVQTIGQINLNRTRDAILSHMDATNMSESMSAFVLNKLSGGQIDAMAAHIDDITGALSEFQNELTRLEQAWPGPATNPVTPILGQFPNNDITTFKANSPIKQVKSDLKAKIEAAVTVPITGAATDMKVAFTEMAVQTKDMVDNIQKFKDETKGTLNIASMKSQVKDYTKTARTYDAYRKIGGLVLSAMTTLIVIFMTLGVAFGFLGQGMSTVPTERGCVSNSGGNLLMAGVAFIFIFSWPLMLLTTFSFIIGAPIERFVCQPLADPELKLIKTMEDKFFSDAQATLGAPVSSVLRGCRDGESAYTAFNLATRFNITTIEAKLAEQKTKIADQMQNTINSVATTAQHVGHFENQVTGFTQLTSAFTTVTTIDLAPLEATARSFPVLDISPLIQAQNKIKGLSTNFQKWENDFMSGMRNASRDILVGGTLDTLVTGFKERIVKIADTYVTSTKSSVLNDVGKCTPVWNLYHSIVVVALCQYTIDSFNGFWFSIGWCLFFFIPSLVFGVKLAKHFRRMEMPDDVEGDLHMDHLGNNKVSPAPGHIGHQQ
ncbi:prominin-1-A-like [Dreissena polymorpha]|nr:prominin-1-A-like [Dreissena polymorpha]